MIAAAEAFWTQTAAGAGLYVLLLLAGLVVLAWCGVGPGGRR